MEIQPLLLQVVDGLRLDLIASFALANRVATGNTESQLETTADDTSAQLTAPFWIYTLQDGRKPTKGNAAKGDPTLFEQIKAWCQAKGIDQKAAYPITKSIHENGYPGTPGIIDEPLSDDNVDRWLNKSLGPLAELFANQISENLVLA